MVSKAVGIINYKTGNIKSIKNSLNYLNHKVKFINNAHDLNNTTHVILPGVGSFERCMNNFNKLKIRKELINKIENKKLNILGICVGMQMLFSKSYEFGQHDGLNIIKGKVMKIKTKSLNVPNIGWSELKLSKSSRLFKNINDKKINVYFMHSYECIPDNNKISNSYINYENKICSSIEQENIFGLQFHPEKSNINGLKILDNFVKLDV